MTNVCAILVGSHTFVHAYKLTGVVNCGHFKWLRPEQHVRKSGQCKPNQSIFGLRPCFYGDI